MLMIVSDSWTHEDEAAGRPLSGAAGKLLRSLLSMHGVDIADAYITCVFNKYVGDPLNFGCSKADAIPHTKPIAKSKYCPNRFASEVERLHKEIHDVQPTLILSLGSTAAWALLGTAGIKNIRGAPLLYDRGRSVKVFPTYHPSAVFREWSLKPVFMADLSKAANESRFPEIRRPYRQVWIEPALDDLYRFEQEHILPSDYLSVDIETAGTQITCIGFAPRTDLALVVPFTCAAASDGNYWKSLGDEIAAWKWVRRMCALPKTKVGQNFIYDMHHLWRNYGITMGMPMEDTMLLHHALQPEMEKGLGFLGSIYTNEASWKFMRKKHETLKRED